MENRDAFGQYLLAQYQNLKKPMKEIVERDDGYIEATDYSDRYFSEYPFWDRSEKRALKLVRGKVLDIGCGAGRHVLYLQKHKFDATGIDSSPGAVAVCKFRGVKQVKLLPIEKIGQLGSDQFDTIIMMGNNLGLLGGPIKAKLLLKKLYRITSDKAQIIAENNHPYKTSNPIHLNYHKFNRRRGRLAGQLKLRVRYKNIIGKWFDYLLVSPQELKEILKGTGWKLKKIIPSQTSTYIAVIVKS